MEYRTAGLVHGGPRPTPGVGLPNEPAEGVVLKGLPRLPRPDRVEVDAGGAERHGPGRRQAAPL